MNDGALLLGGCDALIGFLPKEITTELIESVCSEAISLDTLHHFQSPRNSAAAASCHAAIVGSG